MRQAVSGVKKPPSQTQCGLLLVPCSRRGGLEQMVGPRAIWRLGPEASRFGYVALITWQ